MSRPANLCGYCGAPGRSKEHFWGKWIQNIIPAVNPNTAHQVSRVDPDGKVSLEKGVLTRQGPLRNQQLKVPCQKCNTGWMRQTNEAARSTIEALVRDGPIALTAREARDFATWSIMMTMTYEFADLHTMVTTPEERAWLMRFRQPPKSWTVMIGYYTGGIWAEVQNHRALQLRDPRYFDGPQAQCNLFTLGQTAVATMSGPFFKRRSYLRSLAEDFHLEVVWPLGIVAATRRYPLIDEDMSRIARFGLEN